MAPGRLGGRPYRRRTRRGSLSRAKEPEAMANLLVALDLFLRFARDSVAIEGEASERLLAGFQRLPPRRDRGVRRCIFPVIRG
jgi:hypothetical protein